MAFIELENQINTAIKTRSNFCYETNFNSTPLYWPTEFKRNHYKLRIIYLCLDSIEEAKRRVAIRVENGGHYVSESEITKRYFDGFSNFNRYYSFFDLIDVFDTSAYSAEPEYLFSIEQDKVIIKKFPSYLNNLIPDIAKLRG